MLEIKNGSGTTTIKYNYDAWGKLISATNANGVEYPAGSFAYQNSVRYRGYVYDQETGLYYLQSRYYDPETGRFINADDPDYLGASGSVLSYNAFAYCENNPVNDWDPSGKISVVTSMIIGAFLGVLGLYLMDVLINLAKGVYKWYMFRSTTVDYISAAVSGAISMLSVKKLSTLLSASVSGITYVLNQWTSGNSVSLYTLIGTIGIAIVLDLVFPGDGIDLSNRIGIIKTSKEKVKTLVSKKKITMYKDKISSNIRKIISNVFSTLLCNIMSRAAEESKILSRTRNLFKKLRSVVGI